MAARAVRGEEDDVLPQRQAVDDHVQEAADDEAEDDAQRCFHRNIRCGRHRAQQRVVEVLVAVEVPGTPRMNPLAASSASDAG